jgi:phosphoketolase
LQFWELCYKWSPCHPLHLMLCLAEVHSLCVVVQFLGLHALQLLFLQRKRQLWNYKEVMNNEIWTVIRKEKNKLKKMKNKSNGPTHIGNRVKLSFWEDKSVNSKTVLAQNTTCTFKNCVREVENRYEDQSFRITFKKDSTECISRTD